MTHNVRATSPKSFKAPSVNLAHPLVLFLGVWVISFVLFNLHLSKLLAFQTSAVVRTVGWICLPFTLAAILFDFVYWISPKIRRSFRRDIDDPDYIKRVERSISHWFYCWIALSIVEVAFSGGLPIIWLLTGSSKVYAEFGLPVVHVFLWALIEVLAMGKFELYLLYGDRRRLYIPLFQIFWGVMIVSRGLILSALIQAGILLLCSGRVNLKTVGRVASAAFLIILMFGYLGDMRSGASSFRSLARPSENYPEWLPSGVLWFYIYATDPLANLVHTTLTTRPADDPIFSRTILFAFPTPIRNAIYGNSFDSQQAEGDLVIPEFTVSSAYIGPYRDYGFWGIGLYSVFLGVLSIYCWKKRGNFRNKLRYVIVGQCLLLSIFWNYLFYSPILGQLFWVYLIFSKRQVTVFVHSRHRVPAPVR